MNWDCFSKTLFGLSQFINSNSVYVLLFQVVMLLTTWLNHAVNKEETYLNSGQQNGKPDTPR
jgi:hypothetical protein